MPNHKSCTKRVKTSEIERLRNRAVRSQLRQAIKDVRNETSKDQAEKKFSIANALLDKAAQKHLIHRKNADRNKSRLARFVSNLG